VLLVSRGDQGWPSSGRLPQQCCRSLGAEGVPRPTAQDWSVAVRRSRAAVRIAKGWRVHSKHDSAATSSAPCARRNHRRSQSFGKTVVCDRADKQRCRHQSGLRTDGSFVCCDDRAVRWG